MRRQANDKLVRTEAERRSHRRAERPEPDRGETRQQMIERPPHRHRAVHQLGDKGPIALIEGDLAQCLRHEDVRGGAVIDAHVCIQRDSTRRVTHAGSSERSRGAPRRQSRYDMRRLPSGWISAITSVPATVARPRSPSTPMADEPTADEPTADEPTADEPSADELVSSGCARHTV